MVERSSLCRGVAFVRVGWVMRAQTPAGRITVTAADIAPGGGYPSIQGNAKLAAAEWAAMASFVGRLPTSP